MFISSDPQTALDFAMTFFRDASGRRADSAQEVVETAETFLAFLDGSQPGRTIRKARRGKRAEGGRR